MSGFIQTYQDKIKKGKAPEQTPHRSTEEGENGEATTYHSCSILHPEETTLAVSYFQKPIRIAAMCRRDK